ncbi:hypothetical protein KR084_006225, partial [Drosophila pseudotakahashii]
EESVGPSAFRKSSRILRSPILLAGAAAHPDMDTDTQTPKRSRDNTSPSSEQRKTPPKRCRAAQEPNCLHIVTELGKILDELLSDVNDKQVRHITVAMKPARAAAASTQQPLLEAPSTSNGAPREGPERAANPWRTVTRARQKLTRTRPNAVIVTANGKSYSEILAMVTRRDDDKLSGLGSCVSKVGRTNKGNLLLEVAKGSTTSAESIKDSIAQVLGGEAEVRSSSEESKVVVLEIRDLDALTKKSDIAAALAKQYDFDEGKVKVRSIRPGYSESQIAVISLPLTIGKVVTKGCAWLTVAGLELASQKTEAVLISSRKQVDTAKITVGGNEITSQRAIRYLGVILDTRLCFKQHLEYAHEKANATARALSRILLNTRGPKQGRRKLLASVVTSQLLYAAAVWADATEHKSYMRGAISTYRLCALRVACAFRTVSDDAALVIAGQVPLPELVREAKEVRRKHGEVDFYLTQVLSGYGCFRGYLKKYGHDTANGCPECGSGVKEDARHVLFECHRFYHERKALQDATGVSVEVHTLVPTMLVSQDLWDATAEFAANIMKTLRRLERRRNGQME